MPRYVCVYHIEEDIGVGEGRVQKVMVALLEKPPGKCLLLTDG